MLYFPPYTLEILGSEFGSIIFYVIVESVSRIAAVSGKWIFVAEINDLQAFNANMEISVFNFVIVLDAPLVYCVRLFLITSIFNNIVLISYPFS